MPHYQSRHTDRYSRPTHSRSRSQGRQPKKAYIHPSRFIQSAKPTLESTYTPTNSFSDFDIHPLIHKNLESMGFGDPTPIQDQTIPAGLLGKDIEGIANT